jgi:hypothetical protein
MTGFCLLPMHRDASLRDALAKLRLPDARETLSPLDSPTPPPQLHARRTPPPLSALLRPAHGSTL